MLDRFYPIVDSVDWLRRLLPVGVKLVQLRVKDKFEDETREEIIQARDLCDEHNAQLVVNDYWQIAIEEDCDFVHLGQEDLDDADMEVIKYAGLRVGISTHDRDELERALVLSPDYIALGPVYPTTLKKMRWHQQGLERVSEWKDLIGDIPLVGIGGLNIERAAGVFAAGADIVSLVSDVTMNEDPEARTLEWIKATRA